jgi:hypothetical protein
MVGGSSPPALANAGVYVSIGRAVSVNLVVMSARYLMIGRGDYYNMVP